MVDRKDRIALIIGRLAAIIAVAAGLSLPLGYGLVSFRDISETVEFKARIKATTLNGLIATSPDLWMFAENRIQGLISREPVPFEDEQIAVFDKQGELVVRSGKPPSAPVLIRSYPLYDNERVVGRVDVSGSLRSMVFGILVACMLGLLLGVLVFSVMHFVPLRALRRATNALFEEKERAETTLNSISEAVVTTDAIGNVRYANPSAERLLGRMLKTIQGKALSDAVMLIDGSTRETIENTLYRALAERRVVSCAGNGELRRFDDTHVAVEERSAPIFGQDGEIVGGVVVLREVSESRAYHLQRSWEAAHDLLTSLVNRREFESRVLAALTDVQSRRHSHVICYMDLDRFKLVNDSCGHAAGDELLVQITRLMQSRIRESDTLARLGGDEFGILLDGCDPQRGQVIAAEILAAVRDFQFSWESKLFTIGVSIGLTTITAEHQTVAEVLGEADSACYWAKEQGRNRVCVYLSSDMDLAARRSETSWVARINAAFAENRFVLYHQSYRALNPSSEVREHLEILLRMIGEDGELILPGRFLPAAERYNLISDIDRWVINEVFSHYNEIVADRGGAALTCAINLSGASINSEGFLEFIRKKVLQYRLKPGAICFELTETVAVNNMQAAANFVRECKEMGIQFALDDFGTGTSSFGYLRNLPVDYLKIDGGFVRNIENDTVDLAMTETINRIGHIMGKRVVAEFAENEAIIEALRAMGVDFAQGYGVCMPSPFLAANVEARLKQKTAV